MQALNHTVFGTLIAVSINEPLVALPLALGSHFVLDSIPHYGKDPKASPGTKAYNVRIFVDGLASTLVLLLFLGLDPHRIWLILGCVFLAVGPDFLWPLARHVKQKGPLWGFFKFHKNTQRESRKGIFLEAGWFVLTMALVIYKIHH
ncbi:MAG TPA: hypothetical protein VMR18_03680 [Candidatus Saccharimonadales bacterium]|nr:hypothetical protein [Candidatus Saccharimonadales bacterium]